MLKLLKIIKDVGTATVAYPAKPMDLPSGFRGKPQYDSQKCITCAACTIACPSNALTMETDVANGTRTWQFFAGRCIFCGRCEEVCPTHAVVLSDMFELAVFNRNDLFERGTFKLASCRKCDRPFAPQKEIDYVMDLLAQAGGSQEEIESRREQFETCPECKRRASITNINLSKYLESEKKV